MLSAATRRCKTLRRPVKCPSQQTGGCAGYPECNDRPPNTATIRQLGHRSDGEHTREKHSCYQHRHRRPPPTPQERTAQKRWPTRPHQVPPMVLVVTNELEDATKFSVDHCRCTNRTLGRRPPSSPPNQSAALRPGSFSGAQKVGNDDRREVPGGGADRFSAPTAAAPHPAMNSVGLAGDTGARPGPRTPDENPTMKGRVPGARLVTRHARLVYKVLPAKPGF